MNWKLFWKGAGQVLLLTVVIAAVLLALALAFPEAAARYIDITESPQVEMSVLLLRIALLATVGGLFYMWSSKRR